VLVANHVSAWWLVPFVAIFMTGISLRRSARQHRTP
jgi:paraquat-inducible protein B